MSVGEKIALLRRQRGWTQVEFAEKVGVHSNHVSRWESDRRNPSESAVQKIIEVFGVTAEEFHEPATQLPSHLRNQKFLVEKMEQMLELDPEDQAILFRMLDCLSMQKRVAKIVASVAKSSA